MVRGNLIEKDRYKIPLDDGYTLELDVFHGIYEGLIIAEIEYESIEKAESYKAPGYLYCDVSEYPEYQNSSLSTMSPDEIRELLEKSRRLTS
jgi:CYTH domain-containing protein